jgi:triacylglycerol lipase
MKRLWAIILIAAGSGCAGSTAAPATESGATSAALDIYTATANPIVLIPGLLGFRSLLGTVDYFTGIPQALQEGGAKVFVISPSAAESSTVRAQQIIPQLDALRVSTGATRFNLIGHSQGAMDARYIAAMRPDLVASVTSISGPHRGSPVAEMALNAPLGLGVAGLQTLADLFKLMSGSSDPNDAKAALEQLRPSGAAAFAAQYPAAMPTTACGSGTPVVNGIYYYSWGGVANLTNPLDLLDPVWILGSTMDLTDPNDGLVPKCSTHLGQVIRDDYMANHMDEVNLVFGLVSPFGPSPPTLYRAHANRLKNAGL